MGDQLPDNIRPSLGSVAVIGAGISGLAAAYRLKKEGVEVTVFENQSTVGGKIQSVLQNGLVWEKGANTMTENDAEIGKLIEDLQLSNKRQFPVNQKKRYIVRDGNPIMLPSSPFSLFSTKLLSAQAKMQLLLEPFLWKPRRTKTSSLGNEDDESAQDFMARHFGDEMVDYLVDPFIAGTSGSDASSISFRHSFPDIWALEKKHGSLILGMVIESISKKWKTKEDRGASSVAERKREHGSFSFIGGLQTIALALAKKVGNERFKLNCPVIALECNQQGNPFRNNWKVTYRDNVNENRANPLDQHFDAIIMTAPLHDFHDMPIVENGKKYSLEFLPEVIYEPISVLISCFKKADVKRPLEGFGVLVPSKEQKNGFQTLGTLFSSSMFPDRASPNEFLFTTFIGGSRNPGLASRSREELLDVAMHDLHKLIGIEGTPTFLAHAYWDKAFPRYNLGYDNVLSSFQKLENDLPGFHYAGNHVGGLAVGKALLSGFKAADKVLTYLDSSGGRKIFTMANEEHSRITT